MPGTQAPLWELLHYDQREFPLSRLVADALGVERLDQLGADENIPRLERHNDQSTRFHRAFYDRFDDAIRPTYEKLVHQVIAQRVAEPFCFQATPTFRVQLANNVAVGEFHRDGDYNHPDAELNFWLPLTRAWDTNSVWIETSDAGEYAAVEAAPGDIVHFDAVHRRHGNVSNTTSSTRVSFDFRCIPLSHYVDSGSASVSAGVPLRIGDYYKVADV